MKISTKILMVCLMAMFAVSAAFADLYYETKVSGMPNAGDDVMKTYMSEYGTRVEPGDDTAIIINIKDETFVELSLADKTYRETKFSDFLIESSDDSEIADQMGQMLKQMMDSITETDETQTIHGYDCKKYLVTIMGSESECWLTKDIKGYDKMVKSMDDFREVFSKNPVLNRVATGYDMTKKMDGFPMKIVNKMMGMEVISEVVKVETKTIDKALFAAPDGFSKKQ
jgi:hypothetical protein